MNRSEGQLNRFFLCDHFSESHNFHHISKYVCSIHYYIWIQVNCIYLNQFLTMCVCVGGGGGCALEITRPKVTIGFMREIHSACFMNEAHCRSLHDHEWQISTHTHTHTHTICCNLMHDTHSSARYSSCFTSRLIYLQPKPLTSHLPLHLHHLHYNLWPLPKRWSGKDRFGRQSCFENIQSLL